MDFVVASGLERLIIWWHSYLHYQRLLQIRLITYFDLGELVLGSVVAGRPLQCSAFVHCSASFEWRKPLQQIDSIDGLVVA